MKLQIKTDFDPRYSENRFIPFTTQQLEAMKNDYLADLSLYEIGSKFGISETTVKRRLTDMGVVMRLPGQRRIITECVIARSLALRALGFKWQHVGRLVGFNWQCITADIRARRAEGKKACKMSRS
jgi:predicted DNA-binding protein (UPF0251 family)